MTMVAFAFKGAMFSHRHLMQLSQTSTLVDACEANKVPRNVYIFVY
jgi:hypothetical protein